MSDSASLLPPALLGVAASANGRRWQARLDGDGERLAAALAQTEALPDALARILAGRGVGMADAGRYLEPRLRDWLPDPDTLRDMPLAADRLRAAIARREQVAVFGDYDVDGACSAALLAGFLTRHGVRPRIHIPDRLTEGYGPNVEAIRMLAAEGATLLVAVDCGTTGFEPLAEAKRLGLDVIVLDHHQAGEALPEALALVNPNRQDDLSGLGTLCAAGIVFVTLVAVARALRQAGQAVTGDLMDDLDLVALATVADVVPLVGLNRAFVHQGLKVMARRARLGLRALMDVAGLAEPPAPYHLGFLLGPRINAGGRIGNAALGSRLLLSEDEVESTRIAAELDRLNRERRAVEQAMLAAAEGEALAQVGLDDQGASALLVGAEDWHPGVVGLVAARLKERYRRPAFALAFAADGTGVGSARSIAGVDIGRVVRGAVEAGLLIKGGGHAMAAGITVERARLPEFSAYLERELAGPVALARARQALSIDALLSAGGATPDFFKALERAAPFGQGNPEPVFALAGHRLENLATVGENHMRFRLVAPDGAALGGIAFRVHGTPLGEALVAGRGEPRHAAVTLSRNRRGTTERIEARLIDLAAPTQ